MGDIMGDLNKRRGQITGNGFNRQRREYRKSLRSACRAVRLCDGS